MVRIIGKSMLPFYVYRGQGLPENVTLHLAPLHWDCPLCCISSFHARSAYERCVHVGVCVCVHACLCVCFAVVRSYSYYIEGSLDESDWIRLVDHTRYLCRSWQNLRFPARVVR